MFVYITWELRIPFPTWLNEGQTTNTWTYDELSIETFGGQVHKKISVLSFSKQIYTVAL